MLDYICMRKSICYPIDAWVFGVGYNTMKYEHRKKLVWTYDQWMEATMIHDYTVLSRAFQVLELMGYIEITRTHTEVHCHKYTFNEYHKDTNIIVNGNAAKYLHDRYKKCAQWLNLLLVLHKTYECQSMRDGVCRTSSTTIARSLGLSLKTVQRAHSVLLDGHLIQYEGIGEYRCSMYTVPSLDADGLFVEPVVTDYIYKRPAPKLEISNAELRDLRSLLKEQRAFYFPVETDQPVPGMVTEDLQEILKWTEKVEQFMDLKPQ